MNMKGLGYLLAIMSLMFDIKSLDLGEFSTTYSGKVTKEKSRHHFNSGKTIYQNPMINRYHTPYLPRKNLISNKRDRKNLERKL